MTGMRFPKVLVQGSTTTSKQFKNELDRHLIDFGYEPGWQQIIY